MKLAYSITGRLIILSNRIYILLSHFILSPFFIVCVFEPAPYATTNYGLKKKAIEILYYCYEVLRDGEPFLYIVLFTEGQLYLQGASCFPFDGYLGARFDRG